MKKCKLIGALVSTLKRVHPKKIYVSAIILAAGNSIRMGGPVTKQWMNIGGIPAVVRSLRAFDSCKSIKEIILCVKKDEIAQYNGIAKKYQIKKLKKIVFGSKSRQLSALEGFKNISDKSSYVAIHDAARCLITPQMIEKTVRAAIINGSAIAASKATDTVKVVNSRLLVTETPKRDSVWLASTPQVFETEIYRASAYVALKDNITVTDDASMAEHAGFAVKLVDVGKENIKITSPEDIFLAEAILEMRGSAFSNKE